MSLLDHFRPPLSATRHWESFHAQWASAIAESLNNDLLPADYFAEVQVHVGSRVEIDVATFQEDQRGSSVSSSAGTATAKPHVWAPPQPDLSVAAVFPDSLEVLVFNGESGPTLVAAIELVSPGNKDRAECRTLFAAKCAGYLQQGIGLVIVDVVTSRSANLHNALLDLLDVNRNEQMPATTQLYATAYRPARTPESDRIDAWTSQLQIGEQLPVLPLPLDKSICVRLDLAASYEEACRKSRMR